VERTRIVLVAMPRMLSDIIRELVAGDPVCEVVAEIGVHAPPAAVEAWKPHVVIAGEGARAGWAEELLYAGPRTRVLAVEGDGRTGALLELVPRRRDLGELSPDTLIRAIRAGAETRPTI
jgi:hypothetical protein